MRFVSTRHPVRVSVGVRLLIVGTILTVGWGQPLYGQAPSSGEEMSHRLGFPARHSLRIRAVGIPTRWTKRFTVDLGTMRAMDIARSARGNLGEVVSSLFDQKRSPSLRLYSRLDARFAGPSRTAVAAFNKRDDILKGRPSRELPQNTVLTYIVSAADYSTSIDTYPYVDEDTERDCHRRPCMVLAVDLDDPAHIATALAQLGRIEAEWRLRDWSASLRRSDRGHIETRTMSAYRRLLDFGMQILPASNRHGRSDVLGLVIRPAGSGVLGSYVAVGFIGDKSISP